MFFKRWNEAGQVERKALLLVTTIAIMALVLLIAAGCAGGKPSSNGTLSSKMVIGVNEQIWIMNPDGSNLTHLAAPQFPSQYPSWSPDGNKIAFTGITDECAEGASPSASATGTAAGRSSEDPACTFVMNADGSELSRLPGSSGYTPSWSPDGKKIAFSTGGWIYVMNADGSGAPVRMTACCYGSPAWSPDGNKIAFAGEGAAPDNFGDLYVMNVSGAEGDTNQPENLTDSPGSSESEPSWSPDGTEIAFTGQQGYEPPDIYKMNADGSGITRLTNSPYFERASTWSPNDEKIAYTKWDINGTISAIYVINSDGSNPTLVKNLRGEFGSAGVSSLDWR